MLGVFAVILLLLSVAADCVISSGLRKSNNRLYSVWNDIYDSNINPDILIMGSSECMFGFNTYIIDSLLNCNSYNIGVNGHAFPFQLLRYNTYRRFCYQPKVLIISLSFIDAFSAARYAFEREQLFPYVWDDSLIDGVSEDMKITFFDRYLPYYRYYGYREIIEDGVRSFIGKTSSTGKELYKGFRSDDYEWNCGNLRDNIVYQAAVEPEVVSMLCGFIRQSEKDGISVVLVEFPEYHPIREVYGNVLQVERVFDSIAHELQVPLLDYSELDISFDSMNYYDPNHLNTRGSELFTIRFCHDLDSLKIIQN